MNNSPSLRSIETSVFRAAFLEDGLVDIILGLMLLPYCLWIFTKTGVSTIALIVVYGVAYPLLMYLKWRVTTRRVGIIKPGAARRRKLGWLVVLTILAVALTVGLVLASIEGSVYEPLAGVPVVFWAFGLATIAAAILVAWLLDMPRAILYGALVAVTIPADAILTKGTTGVPLTLITVLVMVSIGCYKLAAFLKRYPVQLEDAGSEEESQS